MTQAIALYNTVKNNNASGTMMRSNTHHEMHGARLVGKPGQDKFEFQRALNKAIAMGLIETRKVGRNTRLIAA